MDASRRLVAVVFLSKNQTWPILPPGSEGNFKTLGHYERLLVIWWCFVILFEGEVGQFWVQWGPNWGWSNKAGPRKRFFD